LFAIVLAALIHTCKRALPLESESNYESGGSRTRTCMAPVSTSTASRRLQGQRLTSGVEDDDDPHPQERALQQRPDNQPQQQHQQPLDAVDQDSALADAEALDSADAATVPVSAPPSAPVATVTPTQTPQPPVVVDLLTSTEPAAPVHTTSALISTNAPTLSVNTKQADSSVGVSTAV